MRTNERDLGARGHGARTAQQRPRQLCQAGGEASSSIPMPFTHNTAPHHAARVLAAYELRRRHNLRLSNLFFLIILPSGGGVIKKRDEAVIRRATKGGDCVISTRAVRARVNVGRTLLGGVSSAGTRVCPLTPRVKHVLKPPAAAAGRRCRRRGSTPFRASHHQMNVRPRVHHVSTFVYICLHCLHTAVMQASVCSFLSFVDIRTSSASSE